MQKQELLAYQKQLHNIGSFLTRCLVDENAFTDTGTMVSPNSQKEQQQTNRNKAFGEIKKLNKLMLGVAAEVGIVSMEEGNDAVDKYAKYVNEIIQQEIKNNGFQLKVSKKYQWLAERPDSCFYMYADIDKTVNLTLEDVHAYYQVTLCENLSLFTSVEYKLLKQESNNQTSHNRPTIREALTEAHKERGRLSIEDLKELMKKYPHFKSLKNLQNTYSEIRDDLK